MAEDQKKLQELSDTYQKLQSGKLFFSLDPYSASQISLPFSVLFFPLPPLQARSLMQLRYPAPDPGTPEALLAAIREQIRPKGIQNPPRVIEYIQDGWAGLGQARARRGCNERGREIRIHRRGDVSDSPFFIR